MFGNSTRAALLNIIKGLDLYADLRAEKTDCGVVHGGF